MGQFGAFAGSCGTGFQPVFSAKMAEPRSTFSKESLLLWYKILKKASGGNKVNFIIYNMRTL
jgi:hypothetical protein